MTNQIRIQFVVLLPLLLQVIGVMFAVLVDPYISKKHRNMMLLIETLVLGLIVQNIIGYQLDAAGIYPYARTVVGILGYCIRPTILALFFYIVNPEKKYRWAWVLIGINAAVHLTALFCGICFSIDQNNIFRRGPLGYTCHIVSFILLAYLLYLTLWEFPVIHKSEGWIPVFNTALIIASVVTDSWGDYREWPVAFLTIAVVSSCVFYYIWLHLQFVRQHENALIAEQRIQIMMTQIQPHFLYNTLATIQALCEKDPKKASKLTGKFGKYLRQNLDSLNQARRIDFDTEMEHTLIYAEIEMVRFPNISLKTEIWDQDFTLPALTIQPMVENAIRHGVRIREQGEVKISTRRLPDCHEIIIADNGKGFDIAKLEESGGSHIGIQNVRERIEQICGGTLEIESRPDEGTTVTIRIPVREEKLES